MTEATRATAREVWDAAWAEWSRGIGSWPTHKAATAIIQAALDKARMEGRREGIEAAAKVCEHRAKLHDAAFAKAVVVRHADHQTHYAARYREDDEITQAILAIDPASISVR